MRGSTAVTMKRLLKALEQTAKIVLVTAVFLWLADWAIFRIRESRGSAFDTVQVQEFLSTALKGNKQEYDYMGTAQVSCARSIFPHSSVPACWWLRRHTTQWE
jgi:hypothetical protein